MALSFVAPAPSQQKQQHHQTQQQQSTTNFFDLQTLFDPYSLQNYQNSNQLQQQQACNNNSYFNPAHLKDAKLLKTNSMEFNNSPLVHHNSSGSNNNNNNSNNNNIALTTTNITQHLNNTNRNLMNAFQHHHFNADYEPIITFVDSPPNSEESWTDDQSKESPQIIDVQTIYSNNGSRKRRMDWDPLDIGQSESTVATAQNNADLPPNKIAAHHLNEKDKYKKEKLTAGRNNWPDDIGFDLNAEFNSNSYLNNESFMPFSPGLTVLKQEPQTEQLKLNTKTVLNVVQQQQTNSIVNQKHDKQILAAAAAIAATASTGSVQENTSASAASTSVTQLHDKQKTINNDSNNDSSCACGSPKSVQQTLLEQQNVNDSKPATNDQGRSNSNMPPQQQQLLTIVDASKIEQSASSAATTTPGPNAASPSSTTPAATYSDEYKFQYILAAATSIATKNNEDTLTYLNQGQSYEIKLKKIGDLSLYRDKILKSVIKICFHERRLQFMEREQMQQWQASRPGERIIEVDVPLSYGLCHVSQPLNPSYLNTVEIFWDPMKEVGVYIKVNCISTEFTPKKHGGEKGVPFRLQIETYVENSNINSGAPKTPPHHSASPSSPIQTLQPQGVSIGSIGSPIHTAGAGNLTPNHNTNSNSSGSVSNSNNNNKQAIHAAACQVKVFKLKGADRKHKQDREKIQKRPQSEQDKFQPSYECTIMTDIPLDLITPIAAPTGCFSPEYMKIWPNSPVHITKYDSMLPFASASPNSNASPIAINSVSSTNSTQLKLVDQTNMVTSPHITNDMDDFIAINLMPDSTPAQVTQWLTYHRLTTYLSTFAHFSGSDIMRMSKEDLIQICGLADGIRMFNILRAKAITPRLTIYISLDGSSFNAIYLLSNTSKELIQKIFKLPGFYEIMAKSSTAPMENGNFHSSSWSMHSKYSGSGSNIYNDINNKSLIYISGPSGVHVAITDEVLNNEIKDGSLYGLEVQNGKVIMKLINKNDI